MFILSTFDACLLRISPYSGLAKFQPVDQNHDLETRILCHFILVLLSSTLMKQLTCYVGITFLISILVWIFSEHDLFQVTGTDSSLHNLFQFTIFEQVTLYCGALHLVYCIVGITLWRFVSHMPLFLGAFHSFSLHQHSF